MIKKIIHGLKFFVVITLFFASFPLAYLMYGRKRIWLISEVDFDARDNGYHLFCYLNKEHPNINSVFLISNNNPNYQIVKRIGKVVKPHSYKHMLIFIAARAKISTLVHGCSPSWCVTKILLKHHLTGKNIALKHGIFKNLHPNYFKRNAHLDLICCGAKPEFDFINKEFGYNEGVARYTGLARFDKLHSFITSNEILIMPTWRRWLDPIQTSEEFENTDYYLNWSSLINDPRFQKEIKTNNLEVCFYLHPKLNRFRDSFKKCANVKLLNSKSGDSVQEHLKRSALLITDFSSVFFDFAYMRKPSLYFQFDENRYFGNHYIKAYFDYRLNGFGPVATKKEELVLNFMEIVNSGLTLQDDYLKRIEHFFTLSDDKNCERIYKAIISIL